MQKKIALNPVKSSQIEQIGHCCDTNTLAVKFKSGGSTYHYHSVSAQQFADLQKSESIGSHLGKHIKPNHKFSKIKPVVTQK